MAFKSRCVTKTKDRIIVFEEKKSKLTFNNINREEVDKVTIDDCEITEGIRCDYLLIKDNYEYFIELKGQDLDHALEQLKETMNKLSKKSTPKTCFIICTRSPMAAAKIQVWQVKFKKDFSANLVIKSTPYSCNI